MNTLLFLTPEHLAKRISRYFRGFGDRVSFLFSGLEYDLRLAESEMSEGEYIVASALNAFLWTAFMSFLILVLFFWRGTITLEEISIGVGSWDGARWFVADNWLALVPPIITFALMFLFFIRYPSIVAGKIVESVDKDLVYALRDLMLQISSGVSLYEGMRNVSRSGYGRVSEEFAKVVQDISTGEAQDTALEKMALRTQSEFLRRTIWQLVTALKAGASLQGALNAILQALRRYQSQNVKAYTQELNLWVLLYIFASVAVPSLFITLLVILSTFGGIGINENFIIAILLACFAAELVLVEYVKVRRPVLRV